jgi:hypothetical protein
MNGSVRSGHGRDGLAQIDRPGEQRLAQDGAGCRIAQLSKAFERVDARPDDLASSPVTKSGPPPSPT